MKRLLCAVNAMKHVATAYTLVPLLIFSVGICGATEIRLLSTVALRPVLEETKAEFENTSGHKLNINFDTAAGVLKRLQGGEPADVVIILTDAVTRLAKEGKLDGANAVLLAKSGVGVVMRTGSPKPSIATLDDLRQALLSAKTVCYSDPATGAVGGTHVASIIQKLGIAEQLKPKLRLSKGGGITELVIELGDGAIGVTQVSEIVGKPGAEFIGPLPESVQLYTSFSAAAVAGSPDSPAVEAFMNYLRSPLLRSVMKAKGMQPD